MTEERLKQIESFFAGPPEGGWMSKRTVGELLSEIRRLKDAEEEAFRAGFDSGVLYEHLSEAWQQYKERA